MLRSLERKLCHLENANTSKCVSNVKAEILVNFKIPISGVSHRIDNTPATAGIARVSHVVAAVHVKFS